jgi:hypothetical protein
MGSPVALLPVIIVVDNNDFEVTLPTTGKLGSYRMTAERLPRLLVLPSSNKHVSSKSWMFFSWSGCRVILLVSRLQCVNPCSTNLSSQSLNHKERFLLVVQKIWWSFELVAFVVSRLVAESFRTRWKKSFSWTYVQSFVLMTLESHITSGSCLHLHKPLLNWEIVTKLSKVKRML